MNVQAQRGWTGAKRWRNALLLALSACGGAQVAAPASTIPAPAQPLRAQVTFAEVVHVQLSGGPGCIRSALGEHCVTPDEDLAFELAWPSLGAVAYDAGYVVAEAEPRLEGDVLVERRDAWASHPLGDGQVYRSAQPVVQLAPNLWRTFQAEGTFAERTLSAFGPGRRLLIGRGELAPYALAESDEEGFLRHRYWPGDADEGGAEGFAAHLRHRLAGEDALEEFAARHLAHRHGLSGEPLRHDPRAGWLIGACLGPVEGDLGVQLNRVDLLDDRTVIDADACLLPWSKRLIAIRYEAASATWLLRVGEVDGTRIVRGGGFFEAGDVILEVAGEAVEREDDIAWHLRDLPTGRRFNVRVQRGERVLRTWARRPRTGDRDAIRFVVVER